MDKSFSDELYDGGPVGTWNDIKPLRFGSPVNLTQTEQAEKSHYTKNAFGSGIPGLKFDEDYSNFDIDLGSMITSLDYKVFIVDQILSKFTSSG